ncbi:MAG TPA: hypothetical protein VED85_08500, partial [Burkholderiaceae bacterium]|nr:hypothetical protein [Burkholderiaceae bacterium]
MIAQDPISRSVATEARPLGALRAKTDLIWPLLSMVDIFIELLPGYGAMATSLSATTMDQPD